jgi:hypothetical protein
LENASLAIWLLESDDQVTRVLRRLQQERSEIKALEKMQTLMGSGSGRITAQERMENYRASRGPQVLTPPKSGRDNLATKTSLKPQARTSPPDPKGQLLSGRHVLQSLTANSERCPTT